MQDLFIFIKDPLFVSGFFIKKGFFKDHNKFQNHLAAFYQTKPIWKKPKMQSLGFN